MSVEGTVCVGDGAIAAAVIHVGDKTGTQGEDGAAAGAHVGEASTGAAKARVRDVVDAANGRSMPMEGTECAWRGWHRPWNASRS